MSGWARSSGPRDQAGPTSRATDETMERQRHPPQKKPKLGDDENVGGGDGEGERPNAGGEQEEEEEALLALIQHRAKEVESLRQKLSYYQSQLEDAERRLSDSQSMLARLRSRFDPTPPPVSALNNGIVRVKTESASSSPVHGDGVRPRAPTAQQSRPQLVIPAPNSKLPTIGSVIPRKLSTAGVASRPTSSSPAPFNVANKPRGDTASRPLPSRVSADSQEKRTKRKLAQKEHRDLIPSIRTCSSPCLIRFHLGTHISSQHKRKLRSLVLNPVDDQMFATSALDGVVNLWQVQVKGPSSSLLSSTDCLSPRQRRWPEDITWHPDGDSLFAAYSADGGDSQISILNLNSSGEKRVYFLEEKPHLKGIINGILFMPWDDLCFVTGGSDHAVILWHEKDGSWKPKTIHRNQHSSAVMGVAGLRQKKIILSAGADKRIVGFDVSAVKSEFKHQIESKCMSILPNPTDFNLFMVQTGAHGKQLRLFDIRLRQTEIHAFGWQQESSESQSALINPAWSPDGWYVSSGSADPVIHIFDIRYNNRTPAQSVQAHQKRVFKAVWHQSIPLLTSISSDLNIGFHRIT